MAETHERVEDTPGMRVAFWSWAVIVAGGLAAMIVLPLLGR
ncbi:hypothetical protein [Microbacterium sp. NPDC096154]